MVSNSFNHNSLYICMHHIKLFKPTFYTLEFGLFTPKQINNSKIFCCHPSSIPLFWYFQTMVSIIYCVMTYELFWYFDHFYFPLYLYSHELRLHLYYLIQYIINIRAIYLFYLILKGKKISLDLWVSRSRRPAARIFTSSTQCAPRP